MISHLSSIPEGDSMALMISHLSSVLGDITLS
jgi:hypothetical protein